MLTSSRAPKRLDPALVEGAEEGCIDWMLEWELMTAKKVKVRKQLYGWVREATARTGTN